MHVYSIWIRPNRRLFLGPWLNWVQSISGFVPKMSDFPSISKKLHWLSYCEHLLCTSRKTQQHWSQQLRDICIQQKLLPGANLFSIWSNVLFKLHNHECLFVSVTFSWTRGPSLKPLSFYPQSIQRSDSFSNSHIQYLL